MRSYADRRRERLRQSNVRNVVRALALAGIVMIVAGTSVAMKSYVYPAVGFGLGGVPARAISLYVTRAEVASRHAPGQTFPAGATLTLVYEADVSTKYARMDASAADAKYAIFDPPQRHDCCWSPARIGWHDDARKGEIAVPIALSPSADGLGRDVRLADLESSEISDDEATALRPAVLARAPLIATLDVGSPGSARLYDLRPATDVEIAAHERARVVAKR